MAYEDYFPWISPDNDYSILSNETWDSRKHSQRAGMTRLEGDAGDPSYLDRSIYPLLCRINPRTEIRLIKIKEEKSPDGKIEIDVMAEDHVYADYIAVSYTWGATKRVETIICSEVPIKVTESCHDVLLALHENNESLPVWIDALCINQADLSERSAQVSRMSDIFYSALWVFGYPGRQFLSQLDKLQPTTGNSGPPRESAYSKTSRRRPRDTAIDMTVPEPEPPNKAVKAVSMGEIMLHHPEAILHLFKSPWFSRLWVVQEILLAKRLFILMGSRVLVPLSVPQRGLSNEWPLVMRMRKDFAMEYGKAIAQLEHLDLRYWRLFEMMESMMQFGCRDPRDRLYSILACFARPIPYLLRPSYSRTVQEVYTDLSWFLVSNENRYSLSLAGTLQAGDKFPSWVTNWAAQRDADPLHKQVFALEPSMWQAGWSNDFQNTFVRREGSTIIVRGTVLSKIVVVTDGSSARDGSQDLSPDPGRKAFSTEGHHAGFAPQDTAVDDYLCIFLGFPAPFVLRQTLRGWLLIGECYVRSIMLGEVMEKLDLSKAGSKSAQPPFQDFEIH